MKLSLKIAWRFLMSARKQTLLIILGIAVGVSVQVFIGALINGLQKSLVDSTIGSSSHITVSSNDGYILNYSQDMQTITDLSDEIEVISPTLNVGGILENNIDKKEVLLKGLNFEQANQIYQFNDKLIADNNRLPETDNEIALGVGYHEKLQLFIGDVINFEVQDHVYALKVVGFFDFGVTQINDTWGITTLKTAQNLVNTTGISSIEMQISKVFDAEDLGSQINIALNDSNLTVDNWMTQNAQLLSGLQGQSMSSIIIQVFVIISVVLGIASTLAITVMQKSRQLGILKAMGMTNKNASKVFISEGLILGVFGAVLGAILGILLLIAFTTFALNPDGSPVVPLTISPSFMILSIFIALLASTVASLLPARKSSKMTVIEVIRNA